MSLFSSLQIANNSLIASQLGLQVTGNNIANANTPGYIRERLIVGPAPTVRDGGLLIGTGVQVEAVVQQTDRFLEERLRSATSDLSNGETVENTYAQLESLLGELSDTDLSTSLSSFFNSIQDILNQPDSVSVRNLSVLQGQTLTANIRRLDERVRTLRQDLNGEVAGASAKINDLAKQIAELNVQIVTAEGGEIVQSDAVGLRDRRANALLELSKLTNIKAVEQVNGDVSVFIGGDYLVFQGTTRPTTVAYEDDRGLAAAVIQLKDTAAPLAISSGKVAGLMSARDDALGGFLDQLDDFTKTLAFEFNKTYSSGQGLTGYSSMTSEFAVGDADAPLNAAGLPFTPVNGSFQVLMTNTQTGVTQTKNIRVDLNGLEDETSMNDLVAQLDAIDGISASLNSVNKLVLTTDSPLVRFSFANDTSGALASLGMNTFFTGTGSSDISISATVASDPSKFAASKTGVGEDANNAVDLANVLNKQLSSRDNASLAVLYDRITSSTAQGGAIAGSVAEGFRVFQRTLEGQLLGVSGVNIDEEAVKMIAYQRAFQASARIVSAVSDLLEVLVNL
jgi:flagellar hook-associated protein 1 FlgK